MDKHAPGIAPFTDKCGCTNTPAFRRCPTHAAAPEMVKELTAIADDMERIYDDPGAAARARALLARVGGLAMAHRAWDVYLNGKLIDTVFYDRDCDAEYVRRGLVEHDGYDPRIVVKGGK